MSFCKLGPVALLLQSAITVSPMLASSASLAFSDIEISHLFQASPTSGIRLQGWAYCVYTNCLWRVCFCQSTNSLTASPGMHPISAARGTGIGAPVVHHFLSDYFNHYDSDASNQA